MKELFSEIIPKQMEYLKIRVLALGENSNYNVVTYKYKGKIYLVNIDFKNEDDFFEPREPYNLDIYNPDFIESLEIAVTEYILGKE
ncbi:hypothetical protein [Lysinibacillus capsici]|uniref:hypothetical protein n=1 Tax=Lysinibacillus capsici TaxID=2115968 RepID=UPI00289DA544|nr:hypothetical protein [Lysinibacillus capsici]